MSTSVAGDDYLDFLRREDEVLMAFVHIADERPPVREGLPLSGLSVGVKDLFDTADFPSAYGSPIYRDHRPPTDAAVVGALKAAGAFIAGKTTTTEFATFPPTQTLNPRNHAHTPGGSSAGSASAVAAGLIDIALGSQTKGSVIRPASFCGVVGFKPSFNRLSRSGVKMLAESLDTVGLFANQVAEVERVYAVLTRDEAKEEIAAPRIAFTRTPQWDEVSLDVQDALLGAVAFLRGAGLSVDEIEMPAAFESLPEQAAIIHDFEAGRSLLPELLNARDKIEPSLAAALDAAQEIPGHVHSAALMFLSRMRSAIAEVFARYDVVLCAAAPNEPPPLSEGTTGSPIMNISWTALHLPCISLPVLSGRSGLPVGLQIVGGAYRDHALLSTARKIEGLYAGKSV